MKNILNAHTLWVFQTFSHRFKKHYLQKCPKEFIRFLCECIFNLVEGNLHVIEKKTVSAYKKQISKLVQRKPSFRERRTILSSPKGLSLLKVITPSIISNFIPELNGRS